MKIAVVILNWNGKDYVLDCLESVEKLNTAGMKMEIIVVDNGSTDGSLEIIQKLKIKNQNNNSKLKIVKNNKNLGFTGGNNVGIKYALENGADYIILLNSDTIVDKDLIIQLIEVAKSDSRIGIVGPKIYFAPGREYHQDWYSQKERGKVFWYAGGIIDWNNILLFHRGVDEVDQGQYDKQIETDFVSGCCLLVKKKVFEKIGLLDDRYFLYLEDADFCQRAKRAGYKVIYTPKAALWHLNAGSSLVGGDLHDYFITRNRLLFGMKYAKLRTKIALLKEGVKILAKGRKWQKIGIRDFYLNRFGKGSWQ